MSVKQIYQFVDGAGLSAQMLRLTDDPLIILYVQNKSIVEFQTDFKNYGRFLFKKKKRQNKTIPKERSGWSSRSNLVIQLACEGKVCQIFQ